MNPEPAPESVLMKTSEFGSNDDWAGVLLDAVLPAVAEPEEGTVIGGPDVFGMNFARQVSGSEATGSTEMPASWETRTP